MPSERALAIYAYMCKQENRLEAELATAKADVQLWIRRAKLAYKKGALDMGRQAKERATAAKAEFDRIQTELTTTKRKKSDLRRRDRVTDETDSIIYAEMLVEQFRLQGFSPEEAETNAIAKRMEAELAVAELKGGAPRTAGAASAVDESGSEGSALGRNDDVLDTQEDPLPAESTEIDEGDGSSETGDDQAEPRDELLAQFDQLLLDSQLDMPNSDEDLMDSKDDTRDSDDG